MDRNVFIKFEICTKFRLLKGCLVFNVNKYE